MYQWPLYQYLAIVQLFFLFYFFIMMKVHEMHDVLVTAALNIII